MFGRLLEAGQTLDQVEAVMRFALQDPFWRSRILSPKSFGDNYAKLVVQMSEQQQPDIVASEPQKKGISLEEWEAIKQKQKVEAEKLSQAPP